MKASAAIFAFAIIALSLMATTFAVKEPVASNMIILSPPNLRARFSGMDYRIPISVANYGYVPYGGSISGTIKRADNLIGDKGCGLEGTEHTSIGGTSNDNTIVMTNRGDCYFVKKSLNIQNIGGDVALIVDTLDESPDRVIMTGDSDTPIHIPSIMVASQYGQMFQQTLNDDPEAEIKLIISFPIPHPDDRVEYDVYMLSSNIEVMKFLRDFRDSNSHFGKNTLMTPHYVIYTCPQCHRQGFNAPYEDCISGGRYCAPDPDLERNLSGYDVVMENLRQLCIYDNPKENDDLHADWWDYIAEFYDVCMNPDLEAYRSSHVKNFKQFNEKCSKSIMKKVGINISSIQNCVNDSFSPPTSEKDGYMLNENLHMAAQARTQLAAGVYYHPLIRINEKNLRGDITKDLVMNALCRGFETLPGVCEKYLRDYTEDHMDDDTKVNESSTEVVHKHPGLSSGTIALLVIGCIIFALMLLFCIKRRMALDMNKQINDELHHVVSQYQSLGDDKFEKKAEKRSLVQASRV